MALTNWADLLIPQKDVGGNPAPSAPGNPGNMGMNPGQGVSIGSMGSHALGGGKGLSTAINLGVKGLGMLAGIPTLPFTGPIAMTSLLSQLATKMGLQGQTTGVASDLMSPIGPRITLNGPDPDTSGGGNTSAPGPGVSAQGMVDAAAVANAITAEATGNAVPGLSMSVGVGPSGPGADGNTSDGTGPGNTGGVGDGPAWHKGGLVKGPGKVIKGKLLKGEYVVNPKATKMFKPMLEAMNEAGLK